MKEDKNHHNEPRKRNGVFEFYAARKKFADLQSEKERLQLEVGILRWVLSAAARRISMSDSSGDHWKNL